jgi:hypothetical protein
MHDARLWRKCDFSWQEAPVSHGRPELQVEVYFLIAMESETVERNALTTDIAYLFTTDRLTGQNQQRQKGRRSCQRPQLPSLGQG